MINYEEEKVEITSEELEEEMEERKDVEDTGDLEDKESEELKDEDGEEVFDEMNKPNTVDVPETKYEKETRTIDVKVDYTEEEINILAQKVAKLNGEKVNLESEKKANASYFKGRIDEKEEEINNLCQDIRLGHHEVPTLCKIEWNPETNTKQYVSITSGLVVKFEAISGETPSLFEKPLDEGEWPESEEDEANKDYENTEDFSNDEKDSEDTEDTKDNGYLQFLEQEQKFNEGEESEGLPTEENERLEKKAVLTFDTEDAVSSTIPDWPPVIK